MANGGRLRKTAKGAILVDPGTAGVMATGLRDHAKVLRRDAETVPHYAEAYRQSAEQLEAIADEIDQADLTLVCS